MPNYHSAFDGGEYVRIADADALRQFQQSWTLHHALQEEQLAYAGRDARVVTVSYYHGGTPLYEFLEIPGIWHEPCIVDVTIGEHPESGILATNYYSISAEKRSELPVIVVRDTAGREMLVAFRLCADVVAEAMRTVARVRSRRMFEWKYGFDGIYETAKRGVTE